MRKNREQLREHLTEVLFDAVGPKIKPPVGIILGSALEVADLAENLDDVDTVCFQLDVFQAQRLDNELAARAIDALVVTYPDLWDFPQQVPTLLYPVPERGERHLKIDMIEQAYHTLAPHGILGVLSPYEKDQFFPQALKKVFGKVHAPMGGNNSVLWCQRGADRPRRRHEIAFQVRIDENRSARFLSRPGVFSYGKFDDGARALLEVSQIEPGARILDLGCGIGTNGILAALRRGPDGFTGFLDSNARAAALAELNAAAHDIGPFEVQISPTGGDFPEHSFDVVLANPPYYAQNTIAQRFIEQSKHYLSPQGVLYLVTKQTAAVAELLAENFSTIEAFERRGYTVFRARA